LFLGLLAACPAVEQREEAADTQGVDVLDVRADYPDPPTGGVQILTPDLEIPPFTESLYCLFGRWDEPDVGVNLFTPLASNEFLHHALFKDANDVEGAVPGAFLPCGGEEDTVSARTAPIFSSIRLTLPKGTGNQLNLPDGVAVKLSSGQIWSADVHFINPTDTPIMVNAAFNLGLVPAEEVQRWVGSFDHDVGFLELPPGVETTKTFDCPLEAGTDLLTVLAHMHGYGVRYLVELVRESGEIVEVLRVDEWEADYRYASPSRLFMPGHHVVQEGDVLRTHCTWFNSMDETLGFPEEMCTTSGALLGMESAQLCTGTPVESR